MIAQVVLVSMNMAIYFSPTRPLWAELVIESPCLSVCVSVCPSAPSGAPPETCPNIKFDASQKMGATEKVLTALLGNEVRSKFFMLIVAGA